MPMAVLKASRIVICRDRIMVSRQIEVSRPLIIASVMMARVGHGIPVY
jgi:hypothetical protein